MLAKQLKMKQKNQKGRFLGILLVFLGTIILGNLLTGKVTSRRGEGTIRSG